MIKEVNAYEGMWRFVSSLPTYILGADEQIELVSMPRGENQLSYREGLPLIQASAGAIALGPAHDVFLQTVVEPGTTPWETDSTQLLASWCARDRRPDELVSGNAGNVTVTEFIRLRYAEPSLAGLEVYLDGAYTCEAAWYYYRSRCPERARLRVRSQSPLSRGNEPGEERD